jgi:hypothetical protein
LAGAGFDPLDVMKSDESNPPLYGRRVGEDREEERTKV